MLELHLVMHHMVHMDLMGHMVHMAHTEVIVVEVGVKINFLYTYLKVIMKK